MTESAIAESAPWEDVTTADDWPASIHPNHRLALEARGISAATARAAKIRSEPDRSRLATMSGRKRWPMPWGPALVIPWPDQAGAVAFHQLRPDNPPKVDGKPKFRYLTPRGSSVRTYTPPGINGELNDTAIPLILTEGALKSLSARQRGFLCVALLGVDCWHPKGSAGLLPELEALPVKGRDVYIAFDSDAASNENVERNERLLAAAFRARGANVRAIRLPPGPNGEKVGLDDFLATNGADALWSLMDRASEPEEPEGGELKQPAAEIVPEAEAARYLESHQKDELPLIRVFRREFLKYKAGAYRAVDAGEVQADVTQFLNRGYTRVTTSAIANVMGQLRAQATIFGNLEPPAWLPDTKHPDWRPRDLLVLKDKIVHLPSLCARSANYAIDATPALLTSSALDFSWVDADECPRPVRWLQFLEELWPYDPESIETLQMWAGYILTANTSLQKMLGLFGPIRSGKGTVLRVLQALVGHANVASPTLSSLAQNFGLWPLIGKTLAIISDARLSGRVDAAVVVERILSITGEDMQTIDRKNLPHVTCRLPVRFMIVSNELPKLTDASGALLSRMIVLRLTKSWYGREDIFLEGKLSEELPGILWWAIAGWKLLQERGRLRQPESASEMLRDWLDISSPVQAFLRDRCDVGEEYEVCRRELYEAFLAWCEGSGRKHPPDQAGFGRDLHAAIPGLRTKQSRQEGRKYVGVTLRVATLEAPEEND